MTQSSEDSELEAPKRENITRKVKSKPKGKGRAKSATKRKVGRAHGNDEEDYEDVLMPGRKPKKSKPGRFGRTAGKQYPPEIRRLLGKANSLYVQGNIVEASKHLQDVVMQCSTIPEPYALLGLIYQDSRKYERALVFYKLACTRDPKNLLNHQETARIAGIIGDHTSRLEALRIIARLNPCDLNVAIERARCLLELDKPKQALDVYAKAAKRFPRRLDIYLDLAESVECTNPPQHMFVHQALAFCLRRAMGKRYLEPDVRDLSHAFASRLREIKLEGPKPKRLPPRPMGLPSRRIYQVASKCTDLLVSKLMESHKRQEPQYEIALQVVEGLVAWLDACQRMATPDGDDAEDLDEEVDSDSDLRDSNDEDSDEEISDSDEDDGSADEDPQDDEGDDDEDSGPMDSFAVASSILMRYGICQLYCGAKEEAAEAFSFLDNEDPEDSQAEMMLEIAKVYTETENMAESVIFFKQVAHSGHPKRLLASFQLGAAYTTLGKHELAADAYTAILDERPSHAAALAGLAEAAYRRGRAAAPSALDKLTPAMEKATTEWYGTERSLPQEDDEYGEEAIGFQRLQLLLQWATLSRMSDHIVDFACVALPLVSTTVAQMDQRQRHEIQKVATGSIATALGDTKSHGQAPERRREGKPATGDERCEEIEGTPARSRGERMRSTPWKPRPVPSLLSEPGWLTGLPSKISSLTLHLSGTMDVVALVGRRALYWLAIELVRALIELGSSDDVAVVASACQNQNTFLRGVEREDFRLVAKGNPMTVLRSMPGGSPILGPTTRESFLRGPCPSDSPESAVDSTWEQYLPPPWRCVEEKDDEGVPRRPSRSWRPSTRATSGPRRTRSRALMELNDQENDGDAICTIVRSMARAPGNNAMWNLLQRVASERGVDAGDGGFHGEQVEALVGRHREQPQGLLFRAHDAVMWNRSKQALKLYSQAHILVPEEPLPYLCLSMQIIRMITTMESLVENDTKCILQGLCCLRRYTELRKGQGMSKLAIPQAVIEQEVVYNLARTYHQVGLDERAIDCYNQALQLEDERGQELRSWHGENGLTMEAAHNLCALYKKAGSTAMAISIMHKYLTVG